MVPKGQRRHYLYRNVKRKLCELVFNKAGMGFVYRDYTQIVQSLKFMIGWCLRVVDSDHLLIKGSRGLDVERRKLGR